jgi:dienelactone hydrolase
MIGDGADWTSAAAYQALAARTDAQASGPKVTLVTFPGATHAFDYPHPPRTNSLGHHMVYNPAATEAACRRSTPFSPDIWRRRSRSRGRLVDRV